MDRHSFLSALIRRVLPALAVAVSALERVRLRFTLTATVIALEWHCVVTFLAHPGIARVTVTATVEFLVTVFALGVKPFLTGYLRSCGSVSHRRTLP